MNVKIYQDIWLCLRFDVVEKDENNTGHRIHPLNYSRKVIFCINDFKDILKAEIRRVKSLTYMGLGYWLKEPR